MTIWAVSLLTMKLSPHSLTPPVKISGIRSLVRSSRYKPSKSIQCSTPGNNQEG